METDEKDEESPWQMDNCDRCGCELTDQVWGANCAFCPKCGRKFECC